jgi:hypothetical protein
MGLFHAGNCHRQLQQFVPQESRPHLRDLRKEDRALVRQKNIFSAFLISQNSYLTRYAPLLNCFPFRSYDVDIRDRPALDQVFAAHKGKIACVIHCAGLKAVGESGEYESLPKFQTEALKIRASFVCM